MNVPPNRQRHVNASLIFGGWLAISLGVGGCRPAPQPPSPLVGARYLATATAAALASEIEPEELVARLEQAGLDIEFDSELPVQHMPGIARIYAVGGGAERLEIYHYPSEAEAREAAGGVSRDGMTTTDPGGSGGKVQVSWAAPPHFHRLGRLLVIYSGTDPTARDVLRSTLGAPFAGAD